MGIEAARTFARPPVGECQGSIGLGQESDKTPSITLMLAAAVLIVMGRFHGQGWLAPPRKRRYMSDCRKLWIATLRQNLHREHHDRHGKGRLGPRSSRLVRRAKQPSWPPH